MRQGIKLGVCHSALQFRTAAAGHASGHISQKQDPLPRFVFWASTVPLENTAPAARYFLSSAQVSVFVSLESTS